MRKLSAGELVGIVAKNSAVAGSKSVMDLLGARVVERSSMECWIFDGRNTEDLKNALIGNEKDFSGSIIN